MNYFKSFSYILLCYNVFTLKVNRKISYDVVEKLKNIFSENDVHWKQIGAYNTVLVNGEFIKLEEYLKNSKTSLDLILKDETNDITNSFVKTFFDISNTFYTFLKCKYSFLVAKLLKFINTCISSYKMFEKPIHTQIIRKFINLLLKKFKKMKLHFSKAIFRLFYLNDLSENLKSSDQTLLISLLTINTFLCKKENKVSEIVNFKIKNVETPTGESIFIDDEDRDFFKLVNQLIYSLENFLSTNCIYEFAILDHYVYDIYNNIIEIKEYSSIEKESEKSEKSKQSEKSEECEKSEKSEESEQSEQSKQSEESEESEESKESEEPKNFNKFEVSEKLKNFEKFLSDNFNKWFERLEKLKLEDAVFPDNLEKIYDSQYLLLKEVFGNKSDLKFPPMQFGMKTKKYTTEIIEDVEKSYDMRQVLKYQIYLVEFIVSIFIVKIRHIILPIQNIHNEKETFDELKLLVNCFVAYTDKFIPKNYPPILLRFISELKNTLLTDLKQPKEVLLLSKETIKLLMLDSNIVTESQNNIDNLDFYLSISMSNLIEKIQKFHYFDSFKKIFEILLQESDTTDHLYSIQTDDRKDAKVFLSNLEIEADLCSLLSNTRKNLLLLWSFLNGIDHSKYFKFTNSNNNLLYPLSPKKNIKKKTLQEYLIPSFDNIFLYMAHVYKNTNDLRFRMILLPILVHFKNTEWILYKENKKKISKKITSIQRTLILAANSLQYYEVNKCKVAELNKSISRKFDIKLDKLNNLHLQILLKTKIYKYDKNEILEYINGVIDTNTFSDILDVTNKKYLTGVQFVHRGLLMDILNLSQDIALNIISYQHVFKFKTLILHYLVVKIYTKLEYTFQFPLRLTKYRIMAIRKYLKELNNIEHTSPLLLDLQDTCQSYLNIFENISEKNIKLFQNQINDQIKAYGVIEFNINYKFKSFNDYYASLKNDIETFKKYLKDTPRNKLLNFENSLVSFLFKRNILV